MSTGRAHPGTIFYVDDDGSTGFTSIQDAIDASSDGDTIIVRPGIYTEHVSIDKSIRLIGRGTRRTIIDGNGDPNNHSSAVTITADGVKIRGFTIRNAMNSGIYIDSANNTIAANKIVNNGLEGIYIHSGDNNAIKNKILGRMELRFN